MMRGGLETDTNNARNPGTFQHMPTSDVRGPFFLGYRLQGIQEWRRLDHLCSSCRSFQDLGQCLAVLDSYHIHDQLLGPATETATTAFGLVSCRGEGNQGITFQQMQTKSMLLFMIVKYCDLFSAKPTNSINEIQDKDVQRVTYF